MRVADRPIPTSIVLDAVPELAHWPVRPVLAVEQKPAPPYVWDDGSVWDDPTKVWDAPSTRPQWRDATCEWNGLALETGGPDEHGLMPAARLVAQLDNADGAWSRWNVDGTPTDNGPGQHVALWAHNASGDWWLFYGTISRLDQRADDTVELEAFDAFSDLAQPVGTFTPGAVNDPPATRLGAILAAASSSTLRNRFAPGLVHLTQQVTEQAPLEEMQTVTGSDGGLLYGDADGTIVSTDRLWRAGRDDQTTVPVISDNVCTAPVIIWDPVVSTNDEFLADRVVLENIANLRSVATSTTPANAASPYTIAEADQQWTTQAEGDALAAFLLAQQGRPRAALDEATLYLLDPKQPALWRAVDWRLLDRVRFLHDQRVTTGAAARLDITVLLVAISHHITPSGWVMTIATTRAVTYNRQILWDTGQVWDDPALVWDY